MDEIRGLSEAEIETIKNSVRQIEETYKILNSTLKPDIFFQRLGFLFDTLLALQPYEKFGIFTENTPTKRIKDIQSGLENRVSRFVSRYMNHAWNVSAKIKTKSIQEDTYSDFVNKLISAFDCADSFWSGNKGFPHYKGPFLQRKIMHKYKLFGMNVAIKTFMI